jgi:hypothetical protein
MSLERHFQLRSLNRIFSIRKVRSGVPREDKAIKTLTSKGTKGRQYSMMMLHFMKK